MIRSFGESLAGDYFIAAVVTARIRFRRIDQPEATKFFVLDADSSDWGVGWIGFHTAFGSGLKSFSVKIALSNDHLLKNFSVDSFALQSPRERR